MATDQPAGLLGNVNLQDLLFSMGVGLLGNRDIGKGLAQGGLLAMQTGRQRQQDERQSRKDAMQEQYLGGQMQNWQQKNQLAQQQQERWQGLLGSPDIPENLRPVLGAMGPQAGAQFLAQQMAPPKPDNQLQEVYDPESPTGTRYVPRAAAAGMPGKPPSGFSLEMGPDGKLLRVTQGRQGGAGGGGLATPTVNKVEEALLNTTERMARVSRIMDAFRPEYLQFDTRWSAMATAAREKSGIPALQPNEADREILADISTFKARAASDLSQTLKEMSGAAVTPQEAERLLKSIPNPGSGLLDGDSATEFKAKMDDVMRDLRRGQARLSWIRSQGFDLNAMDRVPLDSVPKLIQQRGEELIKQGMTPDQAKARLAQEFGLAQ